MLGVQSLRIRSSLLASAFAVATVAAALAAGSGPRPEVAVKTDRLPIPVKVSCEPATCDDPAAPTYRTDVDTDSAAQTTTLTRIPVSD
jgi:hypothetical protein